ncbi:uncharacterized protein si:ch211-195b21.5 [Betta splendens]|uniref:Uncharacterized protein si:ch211-195b21.5 n=1 Tax=Betta splendens TaxID=158456 RepID=A0A6P7PZS3_BETSP|nr:uncharacterized protein si:ch211-195b21.5 [Betta splendens]
MYRPGKPAYGPPQFGPPLPRCPPFRARLLCGDPPPRTFFSGPCGPFVSPGPNSDFLHNRPPGGRFASPPCSTLSIARGSPNAVRSSQRMACPPEPPHLQVPQWTHCPDNSDQAGEEFLRCIADNKPLPDYLKGNMAYNLADAIRTGNALKEAVKSDVELRKITMRKSHSRSRSHGRSCGKSGAKSPVRSKSRARSRSKSRSQSRGRHKCRARGRSRAKSKSRAHSRTRNKSSVRSKSQVRRSRSPTSSCERSPADLKKIRSSSQTCSIDGSSGTNLSRNSLLEGLKMVMNSRELEERLPSLKEAILTVQGSCESRDVECALDRSRLKQPDSHESLTPLDNDSVLLPHERVGSDFSWLHVSSQENVTIQKADVLEDEESFLYGNPDSGGNELTIFPIFSGQHFQQQDVPTFHSQQPYLSKSGCGHDAQELKRPPQVASMSLDSSEYEKIKEILKTVATSDVSQVIVDMQEPSPVGFESIPVPSLSNPYLCQVLESLQCLFKATKDNQAENDASGSSLTPAKHKAGDEKRKLRKQAIICEMESLLKELEGLLKHDELTFLTPVLGLYCQKCEEFFGDLSCAENHGAIHRNNTKVDKHAGDSKGHSHYSSWNQHPHLADKQDHKACGYHRNNRNDQQDRRSERDHRTSHSDDTCSHSATKEILSLRKERMLITVSQGLAPLGVRAKCEENKEKAAEGHGRVKVEDRVGREKSSKDDKANQDRKESSDSSEGDRGKASKAKSMKMKKKKKKKKKNRDGS